MVWIHLLIITCVLHILYCKVTRSASECFLSFVNQIFLFEKSPVVYFLCYVHTMYLFVLLYN